MLIIFLNFILRLKSVNISKFRKILGTEPKYEIFTLGWWHIQPLNQTIIANFICSRDHGFTLLGII